MNMPENKAVPIFAGQPFILLTDFGPVYGKILLQFFTAAGFAIC